MSVKKAFLPIVAMLTAAAEQGKKVKDILDDVTTLCSAKGAGGSATTFERDENGVVAFVKD